MATDHIGFEDRDTPCPVAPSFAGGAGQTLGNLPGFGMLWCNGTQANGIGQG